MPCYNPDPNEKCHVEYRTKDNPDDKRKIEELLNQTKWLEAGLCAIITELEKRNIANEIISQASKSGLIDLMSFWQHHSSEDETRLAVALHKLFSEHEQQVIKQLLNSGKTSNFKTDISISIDHVKEQYKDLNKEILDELIQILNVLSYQKQIKNSKMFYKKDGKTYMIQDFKENIFWLDYQLIWSVFESKLNIDLVQLTELSKFILQTLYNCKVVSVYPSSTNDNKFLEEQKFKYPNA